ncbi:MAG: type II toxin-antitoxin system VapC family toxin [Elusimicrobia bacterium]|nr:type II toxin-antitoxin system VapC family toxin [Elusimicrobiota bacterium]
MKPAYWDTSALLAMLFQEARSSQVRHLAFQEGGLPGYTSFFTFIEMESAIARRLAEGSLARGALSKLRVEVRELEGALALLWPDHEILADARRHVAELGLRPADALQLASARAAADVEARVRFASLDERLNEAARAVGLGLAAL